MRWKRRIQTNTTTNVINEKLQDHAGICNPSSFAHSPHAPPASAHRLTHTAAAPITMSLIAVNSAVKAFSVCSTTLFFKFFVTVSIQGGKSFAAGARSPEDNSFNKDGKLPNQNYGLANTEGDGEDGVVSEKLKQARAIDYRWKRIVQNDLETIPIGLAVFLGSVLVGGHEATNCALMGVFTGARIAHTFAYANELQPHRALLWGTGQLCVLASGLNGFISFLI